MPQAEETNDTGLFESEDFDAYLPEKWNSNMFTLHRRKVKGKLEGIGGELTQVLEDAGLTLAMNLSDEFPSLWNKKLVDTQWLFFSRDEAARVELTDLVDRERTLADTLADPTPRFRQVFLGVSVDKDHLEVGLRLHHDAWVDRQNLLNLAGTPEGVNRFKEVLGALPEHYEVSLAGEETFEPPAVDESVIEKLTGAFASEKQWFFIGAKLPKDQVLILGEDVIDTIKEVFKDLLPVYRFCAWSPENDAISMDTVVKERQEAIEARSKEFDKEKAEREEARKQKEASGIALREEIQAKIEETQAWRQREIAARRAAAHRAAEAAAKEDDAKAKAEAAAAMWNLAKSDEEKAEEKDGNKAEARPDTRPAARSETRSDTRSETRPDNRPRERKERGAYERKPRGRQQTPRRDSAREGYRLMGTGPRADGEIAVGDLVEVKKGFLRRRRGVVQDIDEKGTLRVNFGALASRLALTEVDGLGPVAERRPRDAAGKKDGARRGKPAGEKNRAKMSGTSSQDASKKKTGE